MFRPMAITVCAALFGSLLLALTLVPALASVAFRRGILLKVGRRGTHAFMARATARYGRALTWGIHHRFITVVTAGVILAVSIGSLFFIGTEFMPKLDEGEILVETRKLPGISLTDSVEISKRIEERLRAIPEVADVVIKIGRPDFATEAMGINEGDTYLLLKPKSEWTRFHTKEELIEAIDKALGAIPGIAYNFSQPMEMRMDETVSGVKADLAIKIFGDDFRTLDTLGAQVLRSMSSVQGAADAQMLVTSGVAELSIGVDRAAIAARIRCGEMSSSGRQLLSMP
jgi:cobalt-zinc-cadmium resistance protein CzcA